MRGADGDGVGDTVLALVQIIGLCVWLISAAYATVVAEVRRDNPGLGLMAGLLLGPFGLLLVLVMARTPEREARYRARVAIHMREVRAQEAQAIKGERDAESFARFASDERREAERRQAEERYAALQGKLEGWKRAREIREYHRKLKRAQGAGTD